MEFAKAVEKLIARLFRSKFEGCATAVADEVKERVRFS